MGLTYPRTDLPPDAPHQEDTFDLSVEEPEPWELGDGEPEYYEEEEVPPPPPLERQRNSYREVLHQRQLQRRYLQAQSQVSPIRHAYNRF